MRLSIDKRLFLILALLLLALVVIVIGIGQSLSAQDIGIDPVTPINYPPLMAVHDIPGTACLPLRDAPGSGGTLLACLEEGYLVTLFSELTYHNYKPWAWAHFSDQWGWLPMTREGSPVLFRHGSIGE